MTHNRPTSVAERSSRARNPLGEPPAQSEALSEPQTGAQPFALRDRIAETLYTHNHPGWALRYTDLDQDEQNTYLARADAVLAVLPQAADRAAILTEAADELGRMDYDTDSNDYGYDTYRDAWNGGVMDGADLLRRMAAEDPAAAARPDDTTGA